MRINPDYHAHHSPFGAHSSFTLGRFGATGGFGLERGRPATQDVYIGYSQDSGKLRLLPFFPRAKDAPRKDPADGRKLLPLPAPRASLITAGAIKREMGWASDTWTSGPLTFRILTPFGNVPDPERGQNSAFPLAIIPAILAELELDNRDSSRTARAVFGIGSRDAGLEPINIPGLLGVSGGSFGFATEIQRNAVSAVDSRTGLIYFTVPARTRGKFTIALGFHRGGIVTRGLPCSYLYSRHYRGLDEVLKSAIGNSVELREKSRDRDRELARSRMSPDRKYLLAHATHSYHGSTQLLSHSGKPVWVVNEGEYRMLNTLDLTADQLFFEMKFHPWTTRNVLDLYASRYSFRDSVQDIPHGRKTYPGGLSFCHDMGVSNRFWRRGQSSYEKPDVPGVGSHMTMEELTNWALCATVYGKSSRRWLRSKKRLLAGCLESLMARDNPRPELRDGVLKMDSARCGKRANEITTYDSMDASLSQSRNNLYVAVKTWGTYLALGDAFQSLGDRELAGISEKQAVRCANTIASKYLPREGYIPAVFEAGNKSRIIPAVEGLVFPFILGDLDAVSVKGRFSGLIGALQSHIRTVMRPGTCIDKKSGCWRLSSTSEHIWPSKLFISEFVLESVLKAGLGKIHARGDRAMAKWESEGCADWAFTDQVNAFTGEDLGSRYYPRGVSAILLI